MTERMNRAARREGLQPKDPHVRFLYELDRGLEAVEDFHRRVFNDRASYNRAADEAIRLWMRDHDMLRFELNKTLYELNGVLR